MGELKPFRIETLINAPLETVWRALTEPDRARDWFGWDHDGLEAEIRYILVDHAELFPPERIGLAVGQEIQLVADGDHRTVVRAVLPGSLDDAEWEDLYDAIEEGWRTFLEQLRFLLERQPGGGRRTVYLSGSATGKEVLAAVEALGGTEVWHESRYQKMIVAPDGGLVGVGAQQPLDAAEAGPVSVTVGSYGLDDAGFDELRERWAERWRTVARDPQVTT